MDLKAPKNENYAAIIVEIKNLIPLEKCDNIQGTLILGNHVIVGKDTKIGDVGVYFPVECKLSSEYLSINNLFRDKTLNKDSTKKGYFENNGRVRCQPFVGHKSEGLFMPLSSLIYFYDILSLNIGDTFDELNGKNICSKYYVKKQRNPSSNKYDKRNGNKKDVSKVIDNQFRFHSDTSQLFRNLHNIHPDDLIQISYKIHGTSGISGYVLCKRYIPLREKIGRFFHNIYTNITSFGKQKFVLDETEYSYLYSSRNVIKNSNLNSNSGYYSENIWKSAHEQLEPYLHKGITFYYEIAGFLSNGGYIQKEYDYGCNPKEFKIYIYRITHTNVDGKVYEFSAKQVKDFCTKNGLNSVPELYYGYARDFYPYTDGDSNWAEGFLNHIKKCYNDKDCYICNNKVPEEGVVIRIESNDLKVYKVKSLRFLEKETTVLDSGEANIEDEE